MSIWHLIILIGIAWLTYPIACGVNVAAEVAEGRRPADAGFSFLPELIVFPAAFLGVAAALDHFFMPWGRWIVGMICVLMLIAHVCIAIRAMMRLRSVRRSS